MATSRDTGNIFARFITAQKLGEWKYKTERANLDDFVMFLDECHANFSLQVAII